MTQEIQGRVPEDKKMFLQEYYHAADLFQRALRECPMTDNKYQQEEFHEVMENAMQVLKGTVNQLKDSALKEQNEQISKDYNAYQKDPSDALQDKLSRDLEAAKEMAKKESSP